MTCHLSGLVYYQNLIYTVAPTIFISIVLYQHVNMLLTVPGSLSCRARLKGNGYGRHSGQIWHFAPLIFWDRLNRPHSKTLCHIPFVLSCRQNGVKVRPDYAQLHLVKKIVDTYP